MSANDIMIWPDTFWCFRAEYGPEFLRDDGYRIVFPTEPEWLAITNGRQTKKLKSS